jgi:hypothetical protein
MGRVLEDALDRRLDGYAVVEPQDALLLDADGAGVLGFRGGVPVGAHHADTGRGGPAALADLSDAAERPCHVELHALDDERPLRVFDGDRLRVGAATPAERLAGDKALAAHTRRVVDDRRRVGGRGVDASGPPAPAESGSGPSDARTRAHARTRPDAEADAEADAGPAAETDTQEPADPVVAFLEDEEKIAAIRERARKQAHERAAEWGLTDQLED